MSNIFRSKEIYKRIPGVSSDNNPLRAVQGMYVSGEYRPPYYIDGFVRVSKINTTKPKIVDYTAVTKDLTADPIVNIIGVDCSDIDITFYKKTPINTNPDHTIRVKSITTSSGT